MRDSELISEIGVHRRGKFQRQPKWIGPFPLLTSSEIRQSAFPRRAKNRWADLNGFLFLSSLLFLFLFHFSRPWNCASNAAVFPPPPLKPRRYLAVTIGKTTDIECGYLPADSSYPSAQLHFRSQQLRPPPIQPKTNFFFLKKKKKSPETKVHWNHPAI